MIVTDLFESTAGSSEDTAKQVYQHMIPEFMYTAPTADVKKAISKAMAFGPQISVPDLATYAYGILKTKDLDEAYAINEGDVSTSNLRTMYDLARMAKNYCDAEGQESLNELLRILKWYKDQAEQGVTESSDDNPVANAITRRILMQRTDLLAKYGPVKVMNAIDDVADFVGDVEEIGSSDVSGWIRQIEQSLQSLAEGGNVFMPGIQNTPEYKAGFETGKLPVPHPEGTQQYASYYKGVIDKATPNLNKGVAEGWRDLFRSKSASAAPGPTGSRSLSPTFSALIPNPATGKPYTNAELRALADQTATSPIDATAKKRTGGKKSGEVSMTPNAIRKREARKSVTTAVAPAPNPFGQMVNQLQNYKTSTGGQVRGTATGLKHTASPDNPNAVSTAADNTANPFGKIANQLQNYTTSTGGQVRGTATGLRNTAKSNEPTVVPLAKRSVKSAVRPNFAPQNAGYKGVSYAPNVKTGTSMPTPLGVPAPVARSATKVTSGGPTTDEKAKLARRIAQAVKEPVAEMLQMVETKEDVQRIKKFIDDIFVKHGAVNESAFAVRNRILEHVTQVGAQRRREHARMS